MKNANLRFALRRGFTLIELLVVIGIIGILAGVLLSTFGGSTEAARAAKCLSNMRSLAQAANASAMQSRYYPFAGSCQYVGVGSGGVIYCEYKGWISWLSNNGDPFGHLAGNNPPTSPVNVQICTFDSTVVDDYNFAITNGTLWRAVNQNGSVYTCPTHVRYCQDEHNITPNWSYVMNAKFGYDSSRGSGAVGALGMRKGYAGLRNADRVLLFAELPTTDPLSGGDIALGGDQWSRDCTLQYKEVNSEDGSGNKGSNMSGGSREEIGFVHKADKGRRCAHVAFADGHVEKLVCPKGAGGLSLADLTGLLCEGRSVAFDGSSYSEVKENY